MEHDFDRIKCPVCKRYYKNRDKVYVDLINTIIHQDCYLPERFLQIKDCGTYKQILKKHFEASI